MSEELRERIFFELKDFINKSWFYDNEKPDNKIINVDQLLDFIDYLENEM